MAFISMAAWPCHRSDTEAGGSAAQAVTITPEGQTAGALTLKIFMHEHEAAVSGMPAARTDNVAGDLRISDRAQPCAMTVGQAQAPAAPAVLRRAGP